MRQALNLRIAPNLTMTPQLQQAIRLLQLSAAELQLEVQQQLESNMMLEAVDDTDSIGDRSALNENGLGFESTIEQPVREPDADTGVAEALAHDIPDDLPVDGAWDDIYDIPMHSSGSDNGNSMELENQRGPTESLEEHLLWQINLSPMSEVDKAIAMTIIDALNPDGYLTSSLEDIRASLGDISNRDGEEVGLDEIEAVLHRVQNLDPAGIGARNLGECLSLQLDQFDLATPWLKEARQLVSHHLELLATRDYADLMRRMRLSKEGLQQVIALIQSLNPRPGGHFTQASVEYVTPDVYVRKHRGAWQVELNPDAMPQLRVNPYYAGMIRRADNSPDNTSLKAHLQEARWFIKSLQSRGETLLKVATSIVERQRSFLEYGEEAMKPLVLHDIAEALSMHESTISRVTTRKYMHTPRGIYELKYFFSSHVTTAGGGECSSTAIRAVIKKLIDAENPSKPLSDSKIAAVLSGQGINVARRTVAKYREAMGIPSSNERKQLV